jgi:beta-1,4-mannosyltransferase
VPWRPEHQGRGVKLEVRASQSPVIVLMSTSKLAPRTNPYATMLTSSLNRVPGLRAEAFNWRLALVGRYDVLHLHWPESRLRGSNRWRSIVRQLLFTVALVRARLTRRPIVRTVHNIELPQGISRRERRILQLVERWTVLRIRLNDATPVPSGAPVVTIKHGHYRDWFADYVEPESVPGRVTFFGLIRRYKAVGELARAFSETAARAPEGSLHINGHPSSSRLAEELEAAAAADPRISLALRRIEDAELVTEVGQAELVVLPYPEMHNSGAVLTSLSLNRPVLVPNNDVNRALADEVGPGWVFAYDPPLSGDHILGTLEERRRTNPPPPRLEERGWDRGAAEHAAAYRRATELVRRRAVT